MYLYGATKASSVKACLERRCIDAASQPGAVESHIGLRETYRGAVERVTTCLHKKKRANWASHVTMFMAKFSAEAWVQATVAWNSEACLPMLYKKTYKGATNWGVWHYTDPLPLLRADPATGAPLISVVFGAMPSASTVLGPDGSVLPFPPPSGVWAPRDEFHAPPAPPPQPALTWVEDEPPARRKRRNKIPRQSEA